MEKTICNLCGSKGHDIFFDFIINPEFEERFRLVKCKNCGLVYLSPGPTKKNSSKYYPQETYWSPKRNAFKTYYHLYNFIFSEIKKGRILDIGAGTGLFLSYFKKKGWDVTGVEVSATACKAAKKFFNINLITGDLLNIKLPSKSFDLVTLNNVIEHLHDPKNTLIKIHKLLDENGLIMISCPNIKGFGAQLFKKKWYGIDSPRHLYQFERRTLEKILTESGFEAVKFTNNFRRHNYEILFESFRLLLSPSRRNISTVDNEKLLNGNAQTKHPIVKKMAAFPFKIASLLIAWVEPLFGGGEIITILAKKI